MKHDLVHKTDRPRRHQGTKRPVFFRVFVTSWLILMSAISIAIARSQTSAPSGTRGGYVIERDAEIAANESGPHEGGGQTVAYSFFKSTPKLSLVFRKRVLKPGAAIGYHEQKEDEIYYVLSGHGVMTLDGKAVDVSAGTAVLTRPGSSHGLKQVGAEDLVIMINYEQAAK